MTTTSNLGLKKPDYTDVADIADINDNMDIIDAHTHGAAGLTGAAKDSQVPVYYSSSGAAAWHVYPYEHKRYSSVHLLGARYAYKIAGCVFSSGSGNVMGAAEVIVTAKASVGYKQTFIFRVHGADADGNDRWGVDVVANEYYGTIPIFSDVLVLVLNYGGIYIVSSDEHLSVDIDVLIKTSVVDGVPYYRLCELEYIEPENDTIDYGNHYGTLKSLSGVGDISADDVIKDAFSVTNSTSGRTYTMSSDKSVADVIEDVYLQLMGVTGYVHPTTAGYKHIPSGGASGQVLAYGGASGTAVWQTPDSYTHPTTAGYKHIPSGGSSGQVLAYGGSSGTAVWQTPTEKRLGYICVAASDSPSYCTDFADYICDGTDDQEEIAAALADVASSGGAVYLCAGTYNMTARIEIAADDITLCGCGAATVLDISGVIWGLHVSGNRFTLKDMRIVFSGTNAAYSSAVYFDTSTTHAAADGHYSGLWIESDVLGFCDNMNGTSDSEQGQSNGGDYSVFDNVRVTTGKTSGFAVLAHAAYGAVFDKSTAL